MNAPFRVLDEPAPTRTLNLFALFHLNLTFSSIEEEQRSEVIERCYWPLLDLATDHGPLGLELTGFTLEEIARRDPEWIGRLRALISSGAVELIASGYAQIIGPLVPARVTEKNLEIGLATYKAILDTTPTLALINEQAYSAGLVGLYLDAGFQAILMDWDNCGCQHPDWLAETRYRPQSAIGADGRRIGLIWTNTVAFQKLQRLAHGDLGPVGYIAHVRSQMGTMERALCLYASDAEVFDFRPGRYRTEEALHEGEWQRIAKALRAVTEEQDCRLIRPSDVLLLKSAEARSLQLESAACPIPVKKQRKYNIARWAVTGRDDVAINAACERVYRELISTIADDCDWKELCYLWSSDFRTHVTEKRWNEFRKRLDAMERRLGTSCEVVLPAGICTSQRDLEERYIDVQTPTVRANLDRRRGLVVDSVHFEGHLKPVLGGLPIGHFDDISLQADWYTGDCVFEAPGEPKVTDLEWCEVQRNDLPNGNVELSARIETPRGPIVKRLNFHAHLPRVDFDIVFHWSEFGVGRLRLGHFTLLPDAFDTRALSLTTHNGGKDPEIFRLNGQSVDHGEPVSFLVSSSSGIGLTEGWADLSDGKTRVRIEVDRRVAPLLGLLTYREVRSGPFCQLVLSALEFDDTRKPSNYRDGPRHFRFSVSALPA